MGHAVGLEGGQREVAHFDRVTCEIVAGCNAAAREVDRIATTGSRTSGGSALKAAMGSAEAPSATENFQLSLLKA